MEDHADRYLTVDEVWAAIAASGERIGRTTVYRNLQSLVADGAVLKATAPGGEAHYRLAPTVHAGQLVCLECGHAEPLDCGMLGDFATHVRDEHDFAIDESRTVLYGYCNTCANERKDGDGR